jgi:hypothetical protein
MLARARALAALLAAAGVLATLALGLVPAAGRWPARLALLFVLPLVVSVAATLLLPREPGREGASVRIAGTARFHPILAAAIALDTLPFGVGLLLGWTNVAWADPSHLARRWAAVALAIPLTIAAATLGSEWALRARLWEAMARAGRPREAALLSCAAGSLLALPAIAPGFVAASAPFAAAALVTALLREATALTLFRRGGLFVAGAWRGTLVAFEAFALGDAYAFWSPLARLASNLPLFYLLRVAGPLAALVVVVMAVRRAPQESA